MQKAQLVMKEKLNELSRRLKDLHKLFLENERITAEKSLDRKISPYDFFHLLVQDKDFSWLQPFSALLAELDAFVDEAETISKEDLIRIQTQVNLVLHQKESKIAQRYQYHLLHDGEFILFHSWVNKALNDLSVGD